MFIENAYAENDTITIQDTQTIPETPKAIASGWTSLIPMILIFAVFYFLLIRPQEKRRRNQEELVSSVKRGEYIVTNSGIFGKVISINDNDNTLYIEIAKGVEIKALKTSIADIVSRAKKDELKDKKVIKTKELAKNKK